MSKIVAQKIFRVDGFPIALTAGSKRGIPVVVLGIQLATDDERSCAPLDFISIDYPMKCLESAKAFVERADQSVAIRGKADCEAKFADFIASVTEAFSGPARPKYGSRFTN